MIQLLSFLLVLHLSSCITTNEICGRRNATSFNECNKLELNETTYRCCFEDARFKFKGNLYEVKQCYPVSKEFYDNNEENIKEHKKELEQKGYDLEKFNFDCDGNESNYSIVYKLNYSILIILSLILLSL